MIPIKRELSDTGRIVIKIGTNCLTGNGGIDMEYVEQIALQIASLIRRGKQVLLVTSGAIGMGAMELGIQQRVTDVAMRQACAAIGQPLLMNQYRNSFARAGIKVAQVLLTSDVLARRESYLNLRNAVEELLRLGILPIFNENDCISTAEIGSAFGDNDTLSAYIASKVDADLLVILSDTDCLYDRDPKEHKDAVPVYTVEKIDDRIKKSAGAAGTAFSTGGMKTKIKAAAIAGKAGCQTVIAHGRKNAILKRILDGEMTGTLFLAGEKLGARQRWIMNSHPAGTVEIDEGALKALSQGKSLLPKGVVTVHGAFRAGQVIRVNERIHMVSNYSAAELESVKGKHSSEIESILGQGHKTVVARPEDMYFFED